MRTLIWIVTVLALLWPLSRQANATFGCTIGKSASGFTKMYKRPNLKSPVVRLIRQGAMVSLLDSEMLMKHKGVLEKGKWILVTHSATGDRHWGVGLRGWVLKKSLEPDSCG